MRSLQEHLDDPAMGVPPAGEGAGDAGGELVAEGCAGGSCGVLARFWLELDEVGTVVDCSARVRGRAAAFAAASALCEAARGRSVVDAARLGLGTLHPSFARLDDEDRERALVVEDAFHHALGRWLLGRMHAAPVGTGAERPQIAPAVAGRPLRAVVGMSGGVDSAVALHEAIAEHAGEVAGVTLRLWIDPRAPDPEAACCSPDSVRRARATCHAAGMPHVSIDLRASFSAAVVAPFIAGYAAGDTPNPCVRCNGRFRLDELVRLADVLGAHHVVTGHYARIVERDGVHLVARGVDPGKDQSYMLSEVEPATVARLRFPLGERHKVDVRADAGRRGLPQAELAESQEICFLGGADYRGFLARAGALGSPGQIVHAGTGEVMGTHDGIARFTPGQRRGIGVAHHEPLYVHDVDPVAGRVTVGDDAGLERASVLLGDVRWHVPEVPSVAWVQLRYRARGGAARARIESPIDGGQASIDEPRVRLVLELAQRAPAPGQAAVLYDEHGVVLGVGRILRDAPVAVVPSPR